MNYNYWCSFFFSKNKVTQYHKSSKKTFYSRYKVLPYPTSSNKCLITYKRIAPYPPLSVKIPKSVSLFESENAPEMCDE
jgi:hypothetical protein